LGWRLSKEEYDDENLLPSWEDDRVDYTVLGGMDLRADIPCVLDRYRQSWEMDTDIERVQEWLRKSELKLEAPRYDRMKQSGYRNLQNEDRAFWRRRITADECGELIVAPLGKPYMNLWGEPCCCGRLLVDESENEDVVFHDCRLCQANPNP